MELQTQTIQFVNVMILVIFIAFIIHGYRKGFLLKLISILSFFVVGILSWYLSSPLAKILSLYPKDALPFQDTLLEALLYENLNRIFIFVILCILFSLLVVIIKPMLKILGSVPVVSLLNKVAGSILGGIQALLIFFLAAMFLRLPLWDKGPEIASSSLLKYSDSIGDILLFYIQEPLQAIQKLDTTLQQSETLSTLEQEKLRSWLLEQSIDKEKVDEIMNSFANE